MFAEDMKLTAYILLFSLLILGTDRFVKAISSGNYSTHVPFEMSCCDSHHRESGRYDATGKLTHPEPVEDNALCCRQEDHDSNGTNGQQDHTCPSGCDCCCCFHIMAIEYQFLGVPAAIQRSFHYSTYFSDYHFEYFSSHFQPPRLG